MSTPSRPPSAASPVELEPVTCWPLIFAAGGFVCLGLLVVTGLAAWSALFPPHRPAAVVEAPRPKPAYVPSEPVDLPAQPTAGTDNERQVKRRREVIQHYRPLPPVERKAVESRPALTARARLGDYKPPRERVPSLARPANRSEAELIKMLWAATTEIDLETEKGAGAKMYENGKAHMEARKARLRKLAHEAEYAAGRSKPPGGEIPPLTKNIRDLLNRRADLKGLPLQDEKDCLCSTEEAKALGEVSFRVRRLQATRERSGAFASPSTDRADSSLSAYLRSVGGDHAKQSVVVRPLEQMFQTETGLLRRDLVETLAVIKGHEATKALARRAVFDMSPTIRRDAVRALVKRPLAQARPVFLAALRHPWAPAADHAAQALTDLNDQEAFDSVKRLVDEPDPKQPFLEDRKWYVREVVRVNHLRNCLLCHAVSQIGDPVSAPIPTPGEPLPVVYYSGGSRFRAIRADIIYLRQDFSAMHRVDRSNKWPETQRFDYLVRKRELTAKEIDSLISHAPREKRVVSSHYPQRDAVLYTLYQLGFAKKVPGEPSR
jgi:hypothetical protein